MLIAIATGINTITRVLNCRDSQAMMLRPPEPALRPGRPAADLSASPTAATQCPTRDMPHASSLRAAGSDDAP
jgi:hypothetical protein